MKIGKRICVIAICIIVIIWFKACSDDKHISQKKAEEIANSLVDGGVNFVSYGSNKQYFFLDEKGNVFTITSTWSGGDMDDVTIETVPLQREVSDSYGEVIFTDHWYEIENILEKYGFNQEFETSFCEGEGIHMETVLGTPEKNQEILNNLVSAGVEIDALLDMTYNKMYYIDNGIGMKESHVPFMEIVFYEEQDGKEGSEIVCETIRFEFSTSPDTRWTFDRLYEEVKKGMNNLEITN